ncbi:MAG: hypothetical protein ACO2PP_12320 [Thermocrinis sp.]|uniref:hypothetical protein n=1 Tax=Thermocrinis sp. TaxID=2024383 RepID=UPI003C09FD63
MGVHVCEGWEKELSLCPYDLFGWLFLLSKVGDFPVLYTHVQLFPKGNYKGIFYKKVKHNS